MICFFGDWSAKTRTSATAFPEAGEYDKGHDDGAPRILHRIQMKRSRANTCSEQEVTRSGQHVSKK